MGFSLDSLNPFDNGHVLDLAGGGPGNTWNDVKGLVGLGSVPHQDPTTAVNLNAFQNPAGNFGPQLGGAIGGYRTAAYNPLQAPTSPYTGAAGAGLGAVAGQYAQLASGQGPSLAVQQANQQGATNLQQAESVLGSARGAGDPGAAQLAAQRALTGGQQQIAQNAIQGRTAEELGALQGAGGAYGALGGLGTTQQGQQIQVGQGNQALNASVQNQYLQALAAQNAQQQQGAESGQQLQQQNQLGYSTLNSNNINQSNANTTKFIGSLASAAGGAAAA